MSHFSIPELAVPGFTDARNSDAKAICDLAMYNYVEASLYL